MKDGVIARSIIEIRLSRADYGVLVHLVGYAMGGQLKHGELPDSWKELSDWILVQGDSSNYTYFHDKDILRARKLNELEELDLKLTINLENAKSKL